MIHIVGLSHPSKQKTSCLCYWSPSIASAQCPVSGTLIGWDSLQKLGYLTLAFLLIIFNGHSFNLRKHFCICTRWSEKSVKRGWHEFAGKIDFSCFHFCRWQWWLEPCRLPSGCRVQWKWDCLLMQPPHTLRGSNGRQTHCSLGCLF